MDFDLRNMYLAPRVIKPTKIKKCPCKIVKISRLSCLHHVLGHYSYFSGDAGRVNSRRRTCGGRGVLVGLPRLDSLLLRGGILSILLGHS